MVWHAWDEICRVYFPRQTLRPTDARWSIEREAYKGPTSALFGTKPDIIVVKLLQYILPPGQPPGQPPARFVSRDYLWIECKAASEDSPSGWKNALDEAAERLIEAHPSRTIFLIIAVGWKCITLIWDPTNQVTNQPQFFIRSANGSRIWTIHRSFKTALLYSWIDIVSGEISTFRAMTLDCWSIRHDSQGQSFLTNSDNLSTIERFLIGIETTPLNGSNPDRF